MSLLELYGVLSAIHEDEIAVFKELFVLNSKKKFKVRSKRYRERKLKKLKEKLSSGLKENSKSKIARFLSSKKRLKKKDKARIMDQKNIFSIISQATKWLKIRYGKKMDYDLKAIQEIKKQDQQIKNVNVFYVVRGKDVSGEFETRKLKQRLRRKSKTWLTLFNEFEILDDGAKTNDEIVLEIIEAMYKNKKGKVENKIDIFHVVTVNGKIRRPEEVFVLLAMIKRSTTNATKMFNRIFFSLLIIIPFIVGPGIYAGIKEELARREGEQNQNKRRNKIGKTIIDIEEVEEVD